MMIKTYRRHYLLKLKSTKKNMKRCTLRAELWQLCHYWVGHQINVHVNKRGLARVAEDEREMDVYSSEDHSLSL